MCVLVRVAHLLLAFKSMCLMFARVNGRTGGIFLWQGEFGIAVAAVALDGCVFCS